MIAFLNIKGIIYTTTAYVNILTKPDTDKNNPCFKQIYEAYSSCCIRWLCAVLYLLLQNIIHILPGLKPQEIYIHIYMVKNDPAIEI